VNEIFAKKYLEKQLETKRVVISLPFNSCQLYHA